MYRSLRKNLELFDMVAGDEKFCEDYCLNEYEIIRGYISTTGMLNVLTDDWNCIRERGIDPAEMLYYFLEYEPEEKKMEMAKQLWDELEDVPLSTDEDKDLDCIDEDFHLWGKGTNRLEIWGDMETIFQISVTKDLMNIETIKNKDIMPDMVFDEKTDYPVVTCGKYLNYWTTQGDYDVFIIFHEMEEDIYENICEKIVHIVMDNRKPYETKEQLAKRIQAALEALVEWEYNTPYVIVDSMKKKGTR